MKRESFENSYKPGTKGAAPENWGFKLPQLLYVWDTELEAGRQMRASMTLVAVEQAQFGKNLLCRYLFEATSTVTDELIQSIGFDPKRMRSMEIVPDRIKLHNSETVKEFSSQKLERLQRELFEKFKLWLRGRDFRPLIHGELQRAAKRGPQSRFSESL